MRVVLPNPPDPTADTAAVIAAIVDTARATVRRSGAARVADVTGRVAAELAVWVDDGRRPRWCRSPLTSSGSHRRSGWFYLPSVAKNGVVSRVVKILSVSGEASLAKLHAGIRRDERMKEFVMPEYVLGELCERVLGLAVKGDMVRAVQPIAAEDVLETTELTLVRLLRGGDGTMDRSELERLCLAAHMKRSSFNNRIAYSPIIEDLGGGTVRAARQRRGREGAGAGRR